MLLRLLTLAFILMMTTPIFAQTPTIETGVSNTLAKWRGANYSDVRYKLNLTLEKMSPVLKGTIEIRLKVRGENSEVRSENNSHLSPLTSQIILDWRKIRGKEDLSTVSNVSINDKAAKFEETGEHLVFKDGVIKGENVIKLDFTSPIATSGAAITRYVDKEDSAEYIYSLFVPSDASTAFPVFDQPDLKARFQLNIWTSNYPKKDWKFISNGKLIHQESSDYFRPLDIPSNQPAHWSATVYSFEETKPISTYVFAFAAGDFAEFDKIINNTDGSESGYRPTSRESKTTSTTNETSGSSPTLNRGNDFFSSKIYVRKSQAEKFKQHAAEVFRLNRKGVKFLESWFDYKFPFPKYDLVLIPEFPFGGMEHAGATFLRESSVIFPQEPTKNDFVSRANLIFHEAAHQWFGDTVTMKWFDDLWLKEGFAEFMAYKTLEKVLPEYNAWKIFYERNKQLAYLTDSTRGTTPIYQEIPNLSSAKSAYGNIVYRKAPSFLKQAEFYLGADKFQTAVRAFLKKYEFKNAEWTDLVKEFEKATDDDLQSWANSWVTKRGLSIITFYEGKNDKSFPRAIHNKYVYPYSQKNALNENNVWNMRTNILVILKDGTKETVDSFISKSKPYDELEASPDVLWIPVGWDVEFKFLNYQDYGYGIFLLDEKSRAYVLANIQNEKDDFLRTMMWGSLWDSVREAELAPQDYVELVIKNISVETDESTIQTLLNRVSTAMNYYLSDKQREEFASQLETLLTKKMQNAPTLGQRITFYRAFLNIVSSEKGRLLLKEILNGKFQISDLKLKTKDKFDIVTRLLILGDKDAPQLLAELEKTETSDDAKRYAYAAKAGIGTAENKAKFYNDFVGNKEIPESWIESAFVLFNSSKHAELTLPYLEKALAELPNLKRNRKIFFVNGWLGAFIGGQRSEQALAIVNKFLADNVNLDKDLRLKILENADGLERAVKIRAKFAK